MPRPVGRSINGHYGPLCDQGMIAPGADFTDKNGALSPASFRFLFSMFVAINRIEARLTAAGIPVVLDPDKAA